MSSPTADDRDAESLSALMDGCASEAEAQRLTQHWAKDAKARHDWHAYHLIGDALRSTELVQSADHDRAFLAKLSARLAQEPVVLAPQIQGAVDVEVDREVPSRATVRPSVAALRARVRWAAPVAVAAGFMAVAAALVALRAGEPVSAGSEARMAQSGPLPQAPAPDQTLQPARSVVLATAPASRPLPASELGPTPVYVVNGQMVRDARLDRYLQAHKEFAAGSPLGMPAGYVRNVGLEASQP